MNQLHSGLIFPNPFEMWSPWIFGHSGGVADDLEKKGKKQNSKHRSSKSSSGNNEPNLREEMVQAAINFLSHPNVR